MWKRILLLFGLAVLVVAGFLVARIGPRTVVGLLLYDQRHEGRLRVGDRAPDVTLTALDGTSRPLFAGSGGRPVVLVFGSYT
jgi:hypothetical protein